MAEPTQAAANAVVSAPSFVIVPREDALPKLVWGVVILIFGVIFFVALMVMLSAVLPRLREAARAALRVHPWQTFLLGVTGYLLLGGLAALLFSNASVEYLLRTEYIPSILGGAIAVCALAVIVTFIGATGLVQALGERIERLNGQEMTGLRRTVWSSLTLVGASLFPGIGWFLVLPVSLPLALGSVVRAALPGKGGGKA